VGLIFDDGLSRLFRPMWGENAIVARETAPGTSSQPRAADLIQQKADGGLHVFVKMFGGGTRVVSSDPEVTARFIQTRARFSTPKERA